MWCSYQSSLIFNQCKGVTIFYKETQSLYIVTLSIPAHLSWGTNEILWTSEDGEFAPAPGSTSGSLYSEWIQLCLSDVAVSNSVTVIASWDKTCAAPLCGFFEFVPPWIIVRVKITVWRNRMWKWLNLSWKHLSEVVYLERLDARQGLSLNV